MKSGIELIAQERQEQIEKHGRTVEYDIHHNTGIYSKNGESYNIPQLGNAATQLIYPDTDVYRQHFHQDIFMPHGWNKEIWLKMMNKPYKERLIIAGALIAAEIDRLNNQ